MEEHRQRIVHRCTAEKGKSLTTAKKKMECGTRILSYARCPSTKQVFLHQWLRAPIKKYKKSIPVNG